MRSSRSGSSGGRSTKRGLSGSTKNNGKEKKGKSSDQKTLGMAWGSNSLSASRSSSALRSAPFSDFGSYMVEKNRKLQNQFEAEASSSFLGGSSSGKLIFQGVSIFVDGFTIPSSQELRGYMLKYGGWFENYFSRRRVTHIICSNLPDSKIKNLRSFSRGLPVVKPGWILDSVAGDKLLDWVPYQLDQLVSNQPKLSAFFTSKSCALLNYVTTDAVCPQSLDPSLEGGTLIAANSSELGKSLEDGNRTDPMCHHTEQEIEEPINSGGNSMESRLEQPDHIDTDNEESINNEIYSDHRVQSSPTRKNCLDDRSTKISPTSVVIGPSKHRSTAEDPNFVDNYFKSSRLHFIGTWRNRYRKRFPSISSELKSRSSNLDLSESSRMTSIIHIDMDCFFVSVVIKNHPELHDKPVAVCHSDNPKGTAEISSANYPARTFGVKAGIFVRDAKALCPQLVIVPYNFQAYEEVADKFYNILHKHCNKVQAVSCDEAFLDVTDSVEQNAEILVSIIRNQIFEATGCTASAGIAGNMLMARLATKTAKPNGQCYIPFEKVNEYLDQLPVKALPGIGYVLAEKLGMHNILTCGQLRLRSKDSLRKDFGQKTGEMLWSYCRGVDNRPVGFVQDTKSVGAEVNWGVRFKDLQDSYHFLLKLCKEVSLRLQGCGVVGRTFTLKIKKRRKDAGEPVKYMGCGDCENLSHSITVPMATDDGEVIERVAKNLFGLFHIDVKEIRGVGLQVSKLEGVDTSKQGYGRSSLKSWLTAPAVSSDVRGDVNCVSRGDSSTVSETQNANERLLINNRAGLSSGLNDDMFSTEVQSSSLSAPPPLCNLDIGVVESLPPELFSELNDSYGGKLVEFVAKSKAKLERAYGSSNLGQKQEEGATSFNSAMHLPGARDRGEMEKHHLVDDVQSLQVSETGCHGLAAVAGDPGSTGLMPSSLSQIDVSVLQELPEDLRNDILESLPSHRRQASNDISAFGPIRERFATSPAENHPILTGSSSRNMWEGNPSYWVDKFKTSNSYILNTLAEMYQKLGATGNLSDMLQRLIFMYPCALDESSDGWSDDDNIILCKFLKQYIELKIKYDIEEINFSFTLLKRFAPRSKRIQQVYNDVLPYLQASIGEHYGGKLQISSN